MLSLSKFKIVNSIRAMKWTYTTIHCHNHYVSNLVQKVTTNVDVFDSFDVNNFWENGCPKFQNYFDKRGNIMCLCGHLI